MRPRDNTVYLLDALAAVDEIATIRANSTPSQLRADRVVRAAIERHLITLGEALARAAEQDPTLESRIDHMRAIVGLRNRLVHGYFAIDSERIALLVETDLDALISQLRALTAE